MHQVCALQWSRHEKEILSSHGFSQNQLCLWKYPSMAKVCMHACQLKDECMPTCLDASCCCASLHTQTLLTGAPFCMHAQVAEMSGHTSRVLHLAQSPDGTTVCSAAADETLRFWKCFAQAAPAAKARIACMHLGAAVHVVCGWVHPTEQVWCMLQAKSTGGLHAGSSSLLSSRTIR